ncbi:MAG: hypothetical protein Q9227_008960 [Pyrenula ochraceoflavens]
MVDFQNILNSLKGYAPVGAAPNANGEQPTFGETLSLYLKSKRVRVVLALVAILFIGSLTIHQAGNRIPSLRSPYGADSNTPSEFTAPSEPHDPTVDYTQFAYVQYVTNPAYLCNSLMIFESLNSAGSQAHRLMMFPRGWSIDESDTSQESRLLRKARDEYDVELVPIDVQRKSGDATWGDSFTKLLAFNQTQYKRVMSLDSDATHMDELFLIPSAPVAMPRAYWLNPEDRTLSSQLVLLEPSEFEFSRIMDAMDHLAPNDFDMEIVNNLYRDSCWIIPHRKYDLLSGEFRNDPDKHDKYLGSKEEKWNGDAIIKEAKFLHFSDWPYPKPWISVSQSTTDQRKPVCRDGPDGQDCTDQKVWLWLYEDFRERRSVCSPTHTFMKMTDILLSQRVCSLSSSNIKREAEPDVIEPPSRWEPIF